jgi:Chitobiase/beta-hexosaminidase C-terminal domain
MTTPLSGETIFASNAGALALPGRLIARRRRTTASSAANSATEVSVMRLDDIPLLGGRAYLIGSPKLDLQSTAANDIIRGQLRYTTDGSTPTTSSTPLTFAQDRMTAANVGQSVPCLDWYFPASNQTFSLLLTVSRPGTGSGNVSIAGGTGIPGPITLVIMDCGVDPGQTGADL